MHVYIGGCVTKIFCYCIERHCTMNVHTLIHYVDGVINLGPLWSQSTFAFENLNGWLTSLHNGPSKPDKQVHALNT